MNSGGLGAVVFAVLLIVSMFAPAVSAQTNGIDDGGVASSATDGVTTPQQPLVNTSGAPPIVLKARALDQIRQLEDSGSINETVFSTLYHYRGPTRVNSSRVFTSDSGAIRDLRAYADGNQTRAAVNASMLLTAADNKTAHRAVLDAERALTFARERIDHRGTLRSSQAHLDNARRAYQRGLSALERAQRADSRQAFTHRAQAVTHFRQAWVQSRHVLDRLDGTLDPEVTITTRSDPVRNGSANRTVTATVRAINPERLDTATVLVDGQQRETVNVSTVGVGPLGNATLSTVVTLADRTANVTVVVEATTASGESEGAGDRSGGPPAHAGSGNGNGPPSHGGSPGNSEESGSSDSVDGVVGNSPSATLLLDGDGLNQTYEQEILGTDPLDPDSDAAVTAADESDDEVLDGDEDFDGDGLGTLRELEVGTDPLSTDTDVDDLDDRFELQLTGTDPLDPDSDDDGTEDRAEDPDSDGLTNAEEAAAGTIPTLADADQDGLTDSQELANETDPFESDTDCDGLDDGVERQSPYHTDPTDDDTDDDGVLDGNETYTASATNESLGVSIDVTGQGDVVSTTTIEKPTHARFSEESPLARNVSVAEEPFANFETEGEIDSATLTFEYNESRVSTNESALAVYRFNETLQRYEKLPSAVDPDSDTISANTSHFSTYTVLDEGAYQAFLTRLREAVVTGDTSIIYQEDFEGLSLENSAWTCRNDPYGGSHGSTPAQGFCQIEDGWAKVQEETNRMRYLNRTVTLDVPEDSDVLVTTHVKANVNAQWSRAALKLVIENGSESRTVAALKNDWSGQTRTIDTVTTADVSDFAGETVNISLQADGRWTYRYQNTTSWISVNNITITGGQLEDADGDGIPDLQEQHLPLRNYGVVSTSTATATDGSNPGYDTDGDGLPDGVEVINTSKIVRPEATHTVVVNSGVVQEGNYDWNTPSTYINEGALVESSDGFYGYPWLSDPTEADTDGDGLEDDTELYGWGVQVKTTTNAEGETVPYRWASAGMTADETVRFTSDPKEARSDDDSLDDSEEKELKTDPRSEQTYHLTTEHEEMLRDSFSANLSFENPLATLSSAYTMDQMGLLRNDLEFEPWDPTLDDGTDDFDLKTDQTGDGLSQYYVLKIDGRDRTDYWLSNEQELQSCQGCSPYARYYEQVRTGPWVADTDGDGLTDGQETSGVDIIVDGSSQAYSTNPNLRDTDQDRLGDLAEYRFGGNPVARNSDGDQFGDFADPQPRTENIPPSITATFNPTLWGGSRGVIATDDSGIQRLTLTYEAKSRQGEWGEIQYSGREESENKRIISGVSIPSDARNVTATAIDENETSLTIGLKFQDSSGEVTGIGINAAGLTPFVPVATAEPTPAGEVILGILITGAVTIDIGQRVYSVITSEETTQTYDAPQYVTPVLESYNSGEILLTEGYTEVAYGVTRGYGWEYISATTELTQSEVSTVVNNGQTIERRGPVDYIIGNIGDKTVVLTVIGSTLMAADTADHNIDGYETDPCGNIVWFREHAVSDKKPINDLDELRQYFNNRIKRVFKTPNDRWYYIIKFGENKYFTLVAQPFSELGGYLLQTMLTDGGGFYDSVEDAVEDEIDDDWEEINPRGC